MVHTSFASKVATTMERVRGLRRTSVHSPYGPPTPGASRRRRRSIGAKPSPALRRRGQRMPGCYADPPAPLAMPHGEAVRAVDAAPERFRMLRETESLRPALAAPPETGASGLSWRVPNRVLVRFRPEVSCETREAMLYEAGARVREELAGQELLVEFEPTAAGSAAARRLVSSAAVELCRRVMVIAVGYEAEVEDATPARLPALAACTPGALAGVR